MKRVIGVGGIFFKAKDPKALYEWYREHFGIETHLMVRVRCGAAPTIPKVRSAMCGRFFRRRQNTLSPASLLS